jgi:hypothetical protein
MANIEPDFELVKGVDRYLGVLCKMLLNEGIRDYAAIIANAKVRVVGGYDYDGIDGGIYGHAVYLSVPENIFLQNVRSKHEIQQLFKERLNVLHNIRDEYIADVFLELDSEVKEDWRTVTGLVAPAMRVVTESEQSTIWKANCFRVFLSHKSEAKIKTSEVKSILEVYGASCFVAHEDIHPTKKWQTEIEKALLTMDVLVALLSERFHESDWTDQEIGFALGRGVPVIPVKIEQDPRGFIGAIQAIRCGWDDAGDKIAATLAENTKMVDAYIHQLTLSPNWDHSNFLAKLLPAINLLTPEQEKAIVDVYNKNADIRGAFGFNGDRLNYGPGLAVHLRRLTGKPYGVKVDKMIVIETSKPRPY